MGSFLSHTFANLWSSFADVIPIWSFVGIFVVVPVIRLMGKGRAMKEWVQVSMKHKKKFAEFAIAAAAYVG